MREKVRGFTLVELIVVIAIIGILAMILVPAMMGFIEQARSTRLNSNARSIYSGAQLAITDCVNKSISVIQPDCIYTGSGIGGEAIGYPEGGGDECNLTNYLGEDFGGYFAFMTDSNGYGCVYAMWSEKPIDASLAASAMTSEDVKMSLQTSNPRGCHPLKAEDDT